MFRGISISVVDFRGLPKEKKDSLLEELYCVHRNHFTTSKEDFYSILLNEDAVEIKIQVYRDQQGQMVGYYFVRVFKRILSNKKTCFVLMPQTALNKGYRGWASLRTFFFYNWIGLKWKFRSPLARVCGFASLLSPLAYVLISRLYHSRIHPSHKTDSSDETKATINELASYFGYTEKYEGNYFTVLIGKMALRETHEDTQKWLQSDIKEIQYYMSINPEYYKGYGVMTFVDLGVLKVIACCSFCAILLLKYRISQLFVRKPVAQTG